RSTRPDTECALVIVFMTIKDQLNSIGFKYRDQIMEDIKLIDVSGIASTGICGMMEKHDPPELPRRLQVPVEPVQHLTVLEQSLSQRPVRSIPIPAVRIQRNE